MIFRAFSTKFNKFNKFLNNNPNNTLHLDATLHKNKVIVSED